MYSDVQVAAMSLHVCAQTQGGVQMTITAPGDRSNEGELELHKGKHVTMCV